MQTAFPVAAASIALLCACASASAQKPKPKPQPKSPTLGAIGTSQMPGSICKFNTAYTLGKKGEAQINVSITGAEYVVTRVRTDTLFRFPPLNKKQLVVRFTLTDGRPFEADKDFTVTKVHKSPRCFLSELILCQKFLLFDNIRDPYE